MIPIILANTLLYTVCLLMVAYKPWRKVQNILTNQPNLAVKRIEEWVRESHYAIAETFPQKLGHGCGGGWLLPSGVFSAVDAIFLEGLN